MIGWLALHILPNASNYTNFCIVMGLITAKLLKTWTKIICFHSNAPMSLRSAKERVNHLVAFTGQLDSRWIINSLASWSVNHELSIACAKIYPRKALFVIPSELTIKKWGSLVDCIDDLQVYQNSKSFTQDLFDDVKAYLHVTDELWIKL